MGLRKSNGSCTPQRPVFQTRSQVLFSNEGFHAEFKSRVFYHPLFIQRFNKVNHIKSLGFCMCFLKQPDLLLFDRLTLVCLLRTLRLASHVGTCPRAQCEESPEPCLTFPLRSHWRHYASGQWSSGWHCEKPLKHPTPLANYPQPPSSHIVKTFRESP